MSYVWERSVKATRTVHRCWGCGAKIPAGSPAMRITDTLDGIKSAYYCEDCWRFIRKYPEHVVDDGMIWEGAAWEHWWENCSMGRILREKWDL